MYPGTLRSRREHKTNSRCITSKTTGRIDRIMLAPSVTTKWNKCTSSRLPRDTSKTLTRSAVTTLATTGKTTITNRRTSTRKVVQDQLMTHLSMQAQHWRFSRTYISPRHRSYRNKCRTSTINITEKQLRIKVASAITLESPKISEGTTNGKIIGSTTTQTFPMPLMDLRIRT